MGQHCAKEGSVIPWKHLFVLAGSELGMRRKENFQKQKRPALFFLVAANMNPGSLVPRSLGRSAAEFCSCGDRLPPMEIFPVCSKPSYESGLLNITDNSGALGPMKRNLNFIQT